MKLYQLFFLFIFFLPFGESHAQSSRGAEIISFNTFGQGVMVTRAKMAPLSGTVSNIFFYNRADEPWNGNVWYEYDFELRGAYPLNAWSQIRVREFNGGQLRDAPVNIGMTESLGDKFFYYVLIRLGNKYVYDIREEFEIETYDYTQALAHGNNSDSIIVGGPRVFFTGNGVVDIPEFQNLDFSLGITAFDNGFSGRLPNGAYSADYAVDFTRFYQFTGETINTTPYWQDEFNNDYLDTSKWFFANWTFADTQFTQDNIRFENGKIVFRINRGESSNVVSETNLALTGLVDQSTTRFGGSPSRAIDGNTNGFYRQRSVTHTADESNAWWEVNLEAVSQIDQIEIYNRTDSCCVGRLADFTVSVLDEDDNVVWTQFYSSTPTPSITIDLNSVGKKVRINRDGVLSLAEVRVFGTPEN